MIRYEEQLEKHISKLEDVILKLEDTTRYFYDLKFNKSGLKFVTIGIFNEADYAIQLLTDRMMPILKNYALATEKDKDRLMGEIVITKCAFDNKLRGYGKPNPDKEDVLFLRYHFEQKTFFASHKYATNIYELFKNHCAIEII